jgi:hypothetical protein
MRLPFLCSFHPKTDAAGILFGAEATLRESLLALPSASGRAIGGVKRACRRLLRSKP